MLEVSEDKDKLKEWSKICLEKKLYVRGRWAAEWFKVPEYLIRMSILMEDSIKGWAFLYKPLHENNPIISVYVDKELRGQNYGSLLLSKLMDGREERFEVSEKYREYYSGIEALKDKII